MLDRATLRAAILLLALVANGVEGCPVPRVAPHQLERPLGQRELVRWASMLGTDEGALRTKVLAASAEASAIHDVLRAPSAPFFAHAHTTQRWSLFPVADPDPWWMHVEGRVDGEWVLLYRPNDAEHALPDPLVELLEYRRVRAIWNPGTGGPRADYPRFVDWLAREIRARRDDVDAVRVRFLRYHVSLPGEPPSDVRTWHFEEVRP